MTRPNDQTFSPAQPMTRPPYSALLLPILLTLAALPSLADAAQWHTIGSEKKKMQLAIDLDSKTTTGDTTRIWHRETYPTRQTIDTGAFSYTVVKTLAEFNCSKRTVQVQRRIYFGSDGGERNNDGTAIPTAPVTPDSTLEKVLVAACHKPVEKAEPKPEPAPVVAPDADKKNGKKKGKDNNLPPPPPPPDPHWSYDGKTDGPAQWAKLKADWNVCADGKRQSPIDIRGSIPADLEAIAVDYQEIPLALIDNGHTIQVNAAGAGHISLAGETYELLQFHFHHPAEEKINGKSYDLVAHLVHKSATGKLAVIAVPLQAGKKENSLLRVLWSNLPLEQNKLMTPANVAIDPTALLPKHRSYYTYIGSLTTPPCSEGVLWLVFNSPITVSQEQINSFTRIYKNNARPIQPSNNRVIKASR